MKKFTRDDLWTLETYAQKRAGFRSEVMAHKKERQLMLGDSIRLLFEDEKTIRYQIQEMLRIEKVFEAEGIQDELDAYNPLIPDGHNWKCTMMIEFPDVAERKIELAKLKGVEHKVWMAVEGFGPILAIANEDLERSNEEKTSSVHFMRFELTPEMIRAVHNGAEIYAGVDHNYYATDGVTITDPLRTQLVNDLHSVH